jgi:glutamate 5-kinase
MNPDETHRRIVVKLGTSVLTGGTPHLDRGTGAGQPGAPDAEGA